VVAETRDKEQARSQTATYAKNSQRAMRIVRFIFAIFLAIGARSTSHAHQDHLTRYPHLRYHRIATSGDEVRLYNRALSATEISEMAGPRVLYSYGLDLISQKAEGAVHFYGYDGQGSVRFLTSSAGTVSDTYTYDAFGLLLAQNGSTEKSYLYAGEQWDQELGMYYLRARYYHPDVDRFWTMDRYDGTQRDPLSLHKNLYAAEDPVNRIDPSGEMSFSEVLTISVMSGLVAALTAPVTLNAPGPNDPTYPPWTVEERAQIFTIGAVAGGAGAASGAVLRGSSRGLSGMVARRLNAGPEIPLATRVNQIHSVLDPIAQNSRTTAILETYEGTRVIGSGARDLSLQQKAALLHWGGSRESPTRSC
jgi:RHS repeat-associated protein